VGAVCPKLKISTAQNVFVQSMYTDGFALSTCILMERDYY